MDRVRLFEPRVSSGQMVLNFTDVKIIGERMKMCEFFIAIDIFEEKPGILKTGKQQEI